MPSCSDTPIVERARPLLGTLVAIRVHPSRSRTQEYVHAHQAIDAAFDEVAHVHRCMSFHDPASDVSRLNREALHRPVPVDPLTFDVLQTAREIASRSDGCFDVSIGAELVEWGLLPQPLASHAQPRGTWRDVELLADGRVRFHHPLWIDLGGIAKGYAVDRATQRLREQGVEHSVVNAGGDLRVQGPTAERVHLQVDAPRTRGTPVIEVAEGSVASSCGRGDRRWHAGEYRGPHVDGARRVPARTDRFVCVIADRCMIADALTKIVMARGAASAGVLRRYEAVAYVHDADTDANEGWLTI
jgi:thiamine biosynthesis lipoprotein